MAEGTTIDWFDEDQMTQRHVSRERGLEGKFKEVGARAGHLFVNYAPTGGKVHVAQAYCTRCKTWFFHGKKLEELVGRCGDAPRRR